MKLIYEHQSNPAGVGFLVKEYRQNYFTSPFHFHDLYEIIIIRKSYGKLYTGKNIVDFHEGEIFLFGPGFGHCFYNEKSFVDSGQEAHAIAIFFEKDFLGKDLFHCEKYAYVNDLLKKTTYGVRIKQRSPRLNELFLEIMQGDGLGELITLLKMLNFLATLNPQYLETLNESESVVNPRDHDASRLRPVLQYVKENFRGDISNQHAASLVHLNEAAFCRYFKKRMEQTFSQYVNNVRVTYASRLLLSRDWDVLQVCYECGYNNLSYFNRKFRETTGKSPREFRSYFRDSGRNLMMDDKED